MIFPVEVFVEMMSSWQDLTVGPPGIPTLAPQLDPDSRWVTKGDIAKASKSKVGEQPQNVSICGEERRKMHLVFKKTW